MNRLNGRSHDALILSLILLSNDIIYFHTHSQNSKIKFVIKNEGTYYDLIVTHEYSAESHILDIDFFPTDMLLLPSVSGPNDLLLEAVPSRYLTPGLSFSAEFYKPLKNPLQSEPPPFKHASSIEINNPLVQ